MTWDEYNKLFHDLQLNLVAFQPLLQCDHEVLKLVNAAIEAEREACAVMINILQKSGIGEEHLVEAIRARGQG